MDRRRALLTGGKKQVFVFKEGEGLVFGDYIAKGGTPYNYISNDFIHLGGRAYGSSHDDDRSYGTIIGEKAFVNDSSSWYAEGSAFDVSNYKTLKFEIAIKGGNYAHVGYCEDQRIYTGWLEHSGNIFNEYRISDLYYRGAYTTVSGTARQIVSFDISNETNIIIAMLSPFAYASYYYAEIYNIWFE
jgi:hypothetical protein